MGVKIYPTMFYIIIQENEERSRIRIQNLLNKFQTIQNYLVRNSQEFVIQNIELDKFTNLLDFMQDYILEKIKDAYEEGLF